MHTHYVIHPLFLPLSSLPVPPPPLSLTYSFSLSFFLSPSFSPFHSLTSSLFFVLNYTRSLYLKLFPLTQLQSMALPDSDETISCKIKFSGTNVLEGIKESVACGCVTLPVPAVLKSLPRCSTNRVTVQAKSEPVVQDSETSWDAELQIDENG